MAYKDPEKRRDKDRERQRRYRAWQASGGVTKGVTSEGVTEKALPEWIHSHEEEHKVNRKRGQDIKTFDDLPWDVQQNIRRMSDNNEEFKKRTDAAIRYQHLFPHRYHSSSLSRSSRPEGASL